MKSIVSFFRHLFIPHKENDYKPHFFREHIVLSITIGSVLLLIISYTSYTVIRTTAFGSRVISSVLVELTNRTRIEHGVPPLKIISILRLLQHLKGTIWRKSNTSHIMHLTELLHGIGLTKLNMHFCMLVKI